MINIVPVMMLQEKEKELAILAEKWELRLDGHLTEEEVIRALARRVEVLFERNMEGFFQIMYRLDIPEQKLNSALLAAAPAVSVARLIWERQWEKALSRSIYKGPLPEDEELKW